MIEAATYRQRLAEEPPFVLRHAVERLREGLFDPLSVRLLTAHEKPLQQTLAELTSGRVSHVCVCGAYGQGKSHALSYMHDQLLEDGYAVSKINLDLREVPMHNFKGVYGEIMAHLCLPSLAGLPENKNSFVEQWQHWSKQLLRDESNDVSRPFTHETAALLPKTMPHFFRCILTALAQKNTALSRAQRRMKKHVHFRPYEFPSTLLAALMGQTVPTAKLRHALKYRQVDFYRDASLRCVGESPYLDMLDSLSVLLQSMGHKGLVLLFDEGEAIAQVRLLSRSKSYQILQQLFRPKPAGTGLLSVFAFTEDFFLKLQEEDYEQVRMYKGEERLCFAENYAQLWQGLNIHRLRNLSNKEWQFIVEKLFVLYGLTYAWQPLSETDVVDDLKAHLLTSEGQETRYRLKGLLHRLDILSQDALVAYSNSSIDCPPVILAKAGIQSLK